MATSIQLIDTMPVNVLKRCFYQWKKSAFTGLIAVFAATIIVGCSTQVKDPPTPPDPAKALARSISIIRSANANHHPVLKVLFYGQSISTRKWTDRAMAVLRARYPNVVFDYHNLAIGGWSAAQLERAAARDIKEVYPDLIVFHVYGDHLAYERIIRTFRSTTAADIIIQNDHVVEPVEPLCDAGFSLRWSPPPGCTGHFRFTQRSWSEFMSGIWLPTMAANYSLALEPRRERWNNSLRSNHLRPQALLADEVHPNERGWALMAELFTSWFGSLVDSSGIRKPHYPDSVTILPGLSRGASARFYFKGDRLELLARGPLDGKVAVTIDGKATRYLEGCWQNSRITGLSNVPDWPALRQIGVRASYRRPDIWTLRLTNFNAAQDKFDFSLSSVSGGRDGSGTSSEPFVSKSGNITLDPQDWVPASAKHFTGKSAPEGAVVHWRRTFICRDGPSVPLPDGATEQRHIVATGLSNSSHQAEIRISPAAPLITQIRIYRPALDE